MIFGPKTIALFDVWTFEHFLSGMSIGGIIILWCKKYYGRDLNFNHGLILVLIAAYLWETIEHYLEAGIAGQAVEYWFQGIEYWPNRIISDPLMMIFGYYVIKQYPNLFIPARIICFSWLFIHIFIFPHCMYLQELL